MKIFYTLFISLLITITGLQLSAQCKATLKISDDGKGGYTFQAIVSDTDSVFTSYWLVDSLLVDSNTMTDTFKFYTNGNHRVCFQYSDTTGCMIDTCINLMVEDAEYHPLLDSVNIWSVIFHPIFEISQPPRSSHFCNYNSPEQIYTEIDTTISGKSYKE